MMTKDGMIEKLEALKSENKIVLSTTKESSFGTHISSGAFDGWRNKILAFINQFSFVPSEIINSIQKQHHDHPSDVSAVCSQLDTLIQLIEEEYIDFDASSTSNFDSDAILENLFNRFHKVARQLRTRHGNRNTLNITDEYDVQDLLHALLLINFDDVRPEEWTPSYAGSSSRMDFLLKNERTVIEVKKTRESMTAKTLGEELIVDIEKYKTHPDCEKLYCFVYDPEGLLGNPTGIKNDLENAHKDFLKVFIKPE